MPRYLDDTGVIIKAKSSLCHLLISVIPTILYLTKARCIFKNQFRPLWKFSESSKPFSESSFFGRYSIVLEGNLLMYDAFCFHKLVFVIALQGISARRYWLLSVLLNTILIVESMASGRLLRAKRRSVRRKNITKGMEIGFPFACNKITH